MGKSSPRLILRVKRLLAIEQVPIILFCLKWLFISLPVGLLVGTASAFFLTSLDWATNWREEHLWIVIFLPLGGLAIGLVYHYFGKNVVKGNNQLLEESYSPTTVIPLKMAPLVLFGTIATHFFGGSAGREGTAVQMGGAIADQLTNLFKLKPRDRKILLVTGVSAGFASVFGTPLAGAIFSLEVLVVGRIRYEALLPALLSAIIANYVCHAWQVPHTSYSISLVPELTLLHLVWAILAGVLFGLAAMSFSLLKRYFGGLFRLKIGYPPLRPFVGGVLIAASVWAMGSSRYIGLGIPVIVDSFNSTIPPYDFLIKIILTAFTLGAGFKGGEVTPLFFIGATLGNALSVFLPLPMALLAGMGFVAVFAGATNTPLACVFMGIELFGADAGVFVGVACVVAYLFSGHTGVYGSQIIGSPKHALFLRKKGRKIGG